MGFKKFIKKLKSDAKPMLAVLIDPDKYNPLVVQLANQAKVACFLVGGSKIETGDIAKTVRAIKKISKSPVILFPGDETQLTKDADGLLLLSLLSGRNPDYLIEKHIKAAPIIKRMKLNYLSTAYLLIDGGKQSTTQKVSKTKPLDPSNKSYIINTAIAAEQLGFQAVYLEAGSGAKTKIAGTLIRDIKKQINLPIIVGGGIDSAKKTREVILAGANMVVIGNALEKNVYLLTKISSAF